jgi:segregation and condensation protein A
MSQPEGPRPGYTVRLERVFQGPLDLLLHLVREQEVEIHEVEISRVIAGYLEYLDALRELDIELAGDFLLMAASLMAIKSQSLLPGEEVDLEAELDPRDELIQRLIEYRRFKEAAQGLQWGQLEREQIHPSGGSAEPGLDAPEPELELGELSAWDLLGTFSRLLRETQARRPHHVKGDPRPLRFYVGEIARALRARGRASLAELLTGLDAPHERETLVGAFCALLELVKLGVASIEQADRRAAIEVVFQADVDGDVEHLLESARFEDEAEPELATSDAGHAGEGGPDAGERGTAEQDELDLVDETDELGDGELGDEAPWDDGLRAAGDDDSALDPEDGEEGAGAGADDPDADPAALGPAPRRARSGAPRPADAD